MSESRVDNCWLTSHVIGAVLGCVLVIMYAIAFAPLVRLSIADFENMPPFISDDVCNILRNPARATVEVVPDASVHAILFAVGFVLFAIGSWYAVLRTAHDYTHPTWVCSSTFLALSLYSVIVAGIALRLAHVKYEADADVAPLKDVYLGGDTRRCDFYSADGFPKDDADWGWTRVFKEYSEDKDDVCYDKQSRRYSGKTKGYIAQKKGGSDTEFYFVDRDCTKAVKISFSGERDVDKAPFVHLERFSVVAMVLFSAATTVSAIVLWTSVRGTTITMQCEHRTSVAVSTEHVREHNRSRSATTTMVCDIPVAPVYHPRTRV